jgi:CBS domain-containing protein
MSPRAAWRLESLGFTHVFDYVAGEADWLANGLPTEGTETGRPRATDAVRTDVPTCRLTDATGEARKQTREANWDECLVVNDERIVLGRLRGSALDVDSDTLAEQVMEPGPATIRPDTALEDIAERMQTQNVGSIVVTTSDGRLVGVLDRQRAEDRLDPGRSAS